MALKKLESLLLPVVSVAVRGGVAGLKGTGFAQASGRIPAVTPSFARHLPSGDPDDTNPMSRYEPANHGEAHAAQRAGRSGSPAGVPDSRTLARSAGAAILSGWSVAVGGIGLVDRGWRGLTPTTTVTPDRSLPGYSQSFQRLAVRREPRAEYGHRAPAPKCAEDGRGAMSPARGMPSASTGGR